MLCDREETICCSIETHAHIPKKRHSPVQESRLFLYLLYNSVDYEKALDADAYNMSQLP
jgi:hypothetical protein